MASCLGAPSLGAKSARARHYAEVIRLSEMLADLHTQSMQHSRQRTWLELKMALLTEMCELFETATPVLHAVQQKEVLAEGQRDGISSKTAAAATFIDSYMDTISSQVPLMHPSSSELARLHPWAAGEGGEAATSPYGWDTNQPSASTVPEGGHLALLGYALVRAFGESGLLEATLHVPDSYTLTCFSKVRCRYRFPMSNDMLYRSKGILFCTGLEILHDWYAFAFSSAFHAIYRSASLGNCWYCTSRLLAMHGYQDGYHLGVTFASALSDTFLNSSVIVWGCRLGLMEHYPAPFAHY